MMAVLQKRQRREKALTIGQVDYKDDNSILAFVNGRYERRDLHRNAIERQWYVDVAQYLGYQYHTYEGSSGRMVLQAAPPWRVRLVSNRLLGIVRKIISKALRQRPLWVTLPATEDLEDLIVSGIANKVLRYYWRHLEMDRVLLDAFLWMAVTGNSFLSVVWDPDKGPEFALEEADVKRLPVKFQKDYETVIEKAKATGLRLGELRIEVHSPFEVDPDPECLKLEDASHLLHSKVRSTTWLRDRYGDIIDRIESDQGDTQTLGRYYERRIQSLAGPTGLGTHKNTDEEHDAIMTHTLWVAPSREHRQGYWCVVAGGQLLEKHDTLPNPFRRVPFIHLYEIPVPGRFWGTCALEQCIPLQAEYNAGRSRFVEIRNLMSKPKWLVPIGAGIQATGITNQPGEVIEYTPGFKPEAWQPPPVPDYVRQLLEFALKDIEDISQIHEVTQARAPSGVRSGVAIAQLQEQDEQVLAPMLMLAEKELAKLGSWALQLIAHNVTEERVVKLVGEAKAIESFVFTGGKLFGPNKGRPGVDYFDVEIQLGSQLPISKSARAQYILDLTNAGILDRVADNKLIREMLGLGADESALNPEQLDRQAALRENLTMLDGVLVDINAWDDHPTHLDTHRLFQKQPQFTELLAKNPQILEVFEDHIRKHELSIASLTAPAPPEAGAGLPPETVPQPPPEADEAQSPEEAMALLQASGLPPEIFEG